MATENPFKDHPDELTKVLPKGITVYTSAKKDLAFLKKLEKIVPEKDTQSGYSCGDRYGK